MHIRLALFCSAVFLSGLLAKASVGTETAMPIAPARPNIIAFEPVQARFVRVRVDSGNACQPCIDELEVFGPGNEANLALASASAKATASSCLEGYPIHRIEHLNDGRYGNDASWICGSPDGWAQIELSHPTTVDRVVFSRDRKGQYVDRVPASLEIQVSDDGGKWQTVKQIVHTFVVKPEEMLLLPNKAITLEFPPVTAKSVRLAIQKTDRGQPCIDELEVYGEDEKTNLALASRGGKASASSCLEGYAIHKIEHLNDGHYKNSYSWIAASTPAWAQVELPNPSVVRRVVFSRDRDGTYRDRMPIDFRLEFSQDGRHWMPLRKVSALQGVRVDEPVLGETPIDWAWRIVEELRGTLQSSGRQLAEEVETKEDVQALLDLYHLGRRRDEMTRQLTLRFQPEALWRAVSDLEATYPAYRRPQGFEEKLRTFETQLPQLLQALGSGNASQIEEAMTICEAIFDFQRSVLLANPLLDFDEVLLLQRNSPHAERSDTYWKWGQRYGMTVNWSCDFRPKNPPIAPWWNEQIVAFSISKKEKPFRTIFKARPTEMLQHPELHFDAQRMLFSKPGPQGAFQVFEVHLDGTDLRQITTDTGPDVDNGDPCYLPDGRILFNSTRMFTGVPCEDGNSYVSNLCLTDTDGRNTRLLTFDQESAWHPSLLGNGRVLYTRYEYANVSHQFGRLLFHMNPDGTNQMEYYGSNSYWPNSIFYARAIPNHPTMVVGVVCGHHGPNKTGRLVLFDPAQGRRETSGALQTIPGYGKKVERIVEDTLYGNDWPKFAHPWPLSDKYFLVSARLCPEQEEYGLYLVDVFDNITEICRLPSASLLEPIPLKRRPRPPVIPDRIHPEAKEATVYLVDVYRGAGLKNVPRGTVKKLRLFTYNYVYRHSGRSGFGHLATPGVDGPWEPRYLLGTVPVQEDGSARFKVPANTPIAVQPLDANGRALQLMRSWFTAMPGETLSCVGCHESQNSTPPAVYSNAALGQATKIASWRGPPRGFDYELEVQGVLDRFCVGCHDGSEPTRPNLSRQSDKDKLRINREYHEATESQITTLLTPSFIALHPYIRRPHAESNYAVQQAAEYFADTSPLIQMLRKGHHNVWLDAEAWDRLFTWIDLGTPDQGSWKFSEWGVPDDFYEQRLETLRRFANRTDDVEWLPSSPGKIVEFVAPPTEAEPQPRPACPNWPFAPAEARARQEAVSLPETITLELGNDLEMEFALIPPGEFVMGDPRGAPDERPACRVRIPMPFYMSRYEVTNSQFTALSRPDHDSGHVGWRSIDWRGEGYSLFEPQQPAVRVSWIEAMEFCKSLEAKTGRRATLPTEAQWEWACRAGSETSTWYGELDHDFGPFENLAGREQRDFAFPGKRRWYLRDDRFSDGTLVTAPVGSYATNPWGLHDMHGNVSEWTRQTTALTPITTMTAAMIRLPKMKWSFAAAPGMSGRPRHTQPTAGSTPPGERCSTSGSVSSFRFRKKPRWL